MHYDNFLKCIFLTEGLSGAVRLGKIVSVCWLKGFRLVGMACSQAVKIDSIEYQIQFSDKSTNI